MFDIFYTHTKPNLFPHERNAASITDERNLSRTKFFWLIDGSYDLSDFDFDWKPPKWEEHQTHIHLLYSQFGEEFRAEFVLTEECPVVEHYYDRKYLQRYADQALWKILKTEADWIIDPTWCPNPFEPPYIYVFGNPWYSSVEMPTAEYRVPGATEYKYCDEQVLSLVPNNDLWTVNLDNVEIVKNTWAPNPFEPPYIYVFGNQWYPPEEMPTVEYRMPGATEVKHCADQIARLKPVHDYWSVPEEVDAKQIDFSWVPHPKDEPYIYHFGTEFQMSIGLTYTTPGATEIKFVPEIPRIKEAENKSVIQTVSMFFVDMNNKTSATRFTSLQARYPNIQKIRFMNGWVETIKRCVTRSETQQFWVISSENVYDDFNFEWHAQPWQRFMTHVFASQWQKWSDTFLINKLEFTRHSKWAKTLEEFPNLNFVKDQPVYRPDDIYDIYYVDHFTPGSQTNLERIQRRYPTIKSARYVDNYLDTFKRIVSTAETDYIWIINSVCDYSKFDFTWQPEPWQATMLHVFPSDNQKFGDTFYVHVPSFKQQMDSLELLDWYDTVNYCTEQTVPRLPMDVITYETDTVVDAVKEHKFTGPFAVFKHISVKEALPTFAPSIWRKKDRVIHTFTGSGSVTVVPRETQQYLDTQMYDYPYILPHKEQFLHDSLLDVVYISNGEPMASANWEILKSICPRAKRSDGVTGREKAYKAAAAQSNTPWFYAVFAKTEVLPDFTFEFQPDYLQEPKHYIFHSRNALNGLEYGAMNINLYNKQLVLDTDPGLDFTLSKAHEVVPICASISRFNSDPWITWRSAFREVMKLKLEVDNGAPDIIKHRLDVWCTKAEGENADYCLQGATDSLEFYNSVGGNLTELQKSFDWQWCQDYYFAKYKVSIWSKLI